ncbi:MAG: septum formation initiator family protein, partial [Candidatus Latescibacteria bacterium]|nr:septum formation initiator family protein [Candidatus Latescibacterota bacterium]
MMRSPYQSPKEAPARRFLRLPPRERTAKRRALLWGAGLLVGYLVYTFVGGDSGLIRIRALEHETSELKKRKLALSEEVARVERSRKSAAKDPLLEERVARERFHMVRKGEILYRYRATRSSRSGSFAALFRLRSTRATSSESASFRFLSSDV